MELFTVNGEVLTPEKNVVVIKHCKNNNICPFSLEESEIISILEVAKPKPLYIKINGVKWDTSNLEVNGQTHFTQLEGITAAFNVGKRLPTKSEYEALVTLGTCWDEKLKGLWVGVDSKSKEKSELSLFFPASGFRNIDAFTNVGSFGYYWSASPSGLNGYAMCFYSINIGPSYSTIRSYRFPLRCIQE